MIANRIRPAGWLLVAAAAAACSGGEARRAGAPLPADLRCESLRAAQAEAERTGDYLPPRLSLEVAGEAARPADLQAVARLVADGTRRSVRIEARGGLGKSRMAAALEAHLCASLPVARLDGRTDLADAGGAGEVAARAGAGLPTDGPAALLVDSLDELSPDRRAVVVEGLARLRADRPGLRLVTLARPPVYPDSYAGLAVDATVRMDVLGCDEARARIARLLRPADRAGAFWAFAGRTGLDRRAPGADCRHALLATHRDVETAADVFQAPGAAGTPGPWTRAGLYLAWVRGKTAGLEGAAEVDARLDDLVAASRPGPGTRALAFTDDDCARATGDPARLPACRALLASPVFRREGDHWSFRNQSLADLFLARWAARGLAAPGGGCTALDGLGTLLESNDIVSFLVGLESVRPCLGALAEALCRSGAHPRVLGELVGETPGAPLSADERARAEAQATSGCARAVLEALAGAAPAAGRD